MSPYAVTLPTRSRPRLRINQTVMPWIRFAAPVYWTFYVAAFLGVAVWESAHPRGALALPPGRRWANHGLLQAVSGGFSTILLRTNAVVLAAAVAHNRFGLLNQPWAPFAVRWVAAVVLLDLARYWGHWSFHHVSFLWRIHQVHHSDPDYDVSTGLRFHPLEVFSMQGVYLTMVALIAPPVSAVLASEVMSIVVDFFAHANASLPKWAERLVRSAFVTPDMHRIHHSQYIGEQSRNLGQTFPWWDRLFGTYLREPAAGEQNLATGLKGFEGGLSFGLGL
jgi:sterol desaturase/sphingolipid hydroxylase (fatty acid hydroxylase superfamily)